MHAFYGLDLRGQDAVEQSTRWGWQVTAGAELRIFGDLLMTDGFRLSRLWHTPLYALMRSDAAPQRYSAIFVIEGNGSLRVGKEEVYFGPSSLLIHDDGPSTLECAGPVASIRISHRWAPALPQGMRREEVPLAIQADESCAAVLSATVNTLFKGKPSAARIGDAALLALLNSLVAAILDRGVARKAGPAIEEPDSLFQQAVAVIGEHFADPAFRVSALGPHLGVSPGHLYRIFAGRGTSPAQVLRERRVAYAEANLPLLPTPAEIAAVARASGYLSARALRRALRGGTELAQV